MLLRMLFIGSIILIYRLSSFMLMNLLAVTFDSLETERVILATKNTYYLFPGYIFGGYIISSILLKMFKSPKKSKKEE